MSISDITVFQIEEMQHCIGFRDNRVTGTKHRVMHAYRNHFCTHESDKSWNKLVEIGLAYKESAGENGITYYHLTGEGMKFLANLCGLEKIFEI